MALERELETYKHKLAGLRDDEGKYALVRGDELDVFTSYADAIKIGYQRFGLEPFMVKRIEQVELPLLITRLLVPHPI